MHPLFVLGLTLVVKAGQFPELNKGKKKEFKVGFYSFAFLSSAQITKGSGDRQFLPGGNKTLLSLREELELSSSSQELRGQKYQRRFRQHCFAPVTETNLNQLAGDYRTITVSGLMYLQYFENTSNILKCKSVAGESCSEMKFQHSFHENVFQNQL